MNIPKFAVNKPVSVSMFLLAILILGGISLSLLKIEMLPKIEIPKLVIETVYTDALPEEVEELVTKPLEETLCTLQGLKNISSTSSTGKSIITLEFYWKTDIDLATVKTREKLDRVKASLPNNVERPNILNFDPSEQAIISYAVKGSNDLYELSQIGKYLIKRRFEQIDGVAKAEISGEVEREIIIQISPIKLFQYGITEDLIANEIRALNRSYSGGKLIDGWYEYSVVFPKNLENAEDLRLVAIYNDNGDKFLLSELGNVYDQNKVRTTIARVNGEDAVILNIIKNSDANTVEVCKRVRAFSETWNRANEKITLQLLHDDSQTVLKAINSVVQAILIGGALAFFILMIFLKNIKSPLTIAVSMPFSIIMTFILLYFSGISLNMLSMGGLAIGIGLLVDNSIIVLENIIRYKEKGVPIKKACIDGTNEVLLSISAGTFTTIAVFFPIIYLTGVSAIFFKEQGITITYALLASLLMAITLVPSIFSKTYKSFTPHFHRKKKIRLHDTMQHAHSSKSFSQVGAGQKILFILKKIVIPFLFIFWLLLQLKEFLKYLLKTCIIFIHYFIYSIFISFFRFLNKLIKPIGEKNERFWSMVKNHYEILLKKVLDKRGATIMITILIFILSLFAAGLVPRRFMPDIKPDKLHIIINQESGTALNMTSQTMQKMEDFLLTVPEVKSIESFIGEEYSDIGLLSFKKNSEHKGYMVISLESHKIKDIQIFKRDLQESLLSMLNQRKDARAFHKIDISVISGDNIYEDIFSFGDYPFEINISINNLDKLEECITIIEDKLRALGYFSEIKSNLNITNPTYVIHLRDDVLKIHNLSKYDVMRKLQTLNVGTAIDEIVLGSEINEIILRNYKQTEERRNLELDRFLKEKIYLGDHLYTVQDIIELEKDYTPEEIFRNNQIRTATIFAKLKPKADYGKALTSIENYLSPLSKQLDFKYELSGETKRIKENFSGLIFAFILAIILVYMILGIQFESFYLPFVIILTIPLSAIGMIWGLLITGMSINIMSLIGLVILVGIVVNDSIVKIDTIRRLRESGIDLIDSVMQAGSQRFRPIVMTSLTTIFGLLPLALGWGSGAQLTKPLAVTVISGLIVSTLLTLLVIPTIYVTLENMKKHT